MNILTYTITERSRLAATRNFMSTQGYKPRYLRRLHLPIYPTFMVLTSHFDSSRFDMAFGHERIVLGGYPFHNL